MRRAGRWLAASPCTGFGSPGGTIATIPPPSRQLLRGTFSVISEVEISLPAEDFRHADREAAEALVRSQVCGGWTLLPERCDDGGFTGGNMDRPALRCLLAGTDLNDCYAVNRGP